MICIYCLHKKTTTINSRSYKDLPATWRRHKCPDCHKIWTTQEEVDLSAIYLVRPKEGTKTQPFSTGILYKSVYDALTYAHLSPQRTEWLTRTICHKVMQRFRPDHALASHEIAVIAYETLNTYNQLAAMAYATHHGVEIKRAGRPIKKANQP